MARSSQGEEHFQGDSNWQVSPRVRADSAGCRAVRQAGGVVLTRTVDVPRLGRAKST